MKLNHKLNQSGLVSIVSTILIILIITVITLSLSALSRRNLRQALDEQLSTQALYAAESGINDAIAKKDSLSSISDCATSATFFPDRNLDDSGNVRYTCVLVDKTPSSINTDVVRDSVKTYPLEGTTFISRLVVTWRSKDTSFVPTFTSCTNLNTCLTSQTDWTSSNRLGVLRLRLIPINSSLSSGNMRNTIDILAYPGTLNGNNDASVTTSSARQKMTFGNCSDKSCKITVSALYSSGSTTNPGKYYLQLYSYYDDINVTVEALNSSSQPINLIGAQMTIDSTGAASDVFKRLRVNIPLSSTSSLPPYALSTGESLCKRFTTNATETLDGDSSCSAF